MPWRGTILVVALGTALVYAIAAASGGAPSAQAIVIVMFALVGLFGAIRMTRSGRSGALEAQTARVRDSVRELRRMTTERRRPARPARPKSRTRTIDVFPWPEDEDLDPLDDRSLVRRMTEGLAPNPVAAGKAGTAASRQEFLSQLIREGEVLRALGRLLKVDLVPYADELSRGLAAARDGRVDECALILQLANDRLRTEIQAALTRQLSVGRSPPSFDRR